VYVCEMVKKCSIISVRLVYIFEFLILLVVILKETRSETRHIIVYVVDRFTNQYISGGSQVLTHTQLQTSQSWSYIKEMRHNSVVHSHKINIYILTQPHFRRFSFSKKDLSGVVSRTSLR